jgi:chromosome segregation ATPase
MADISQEILELNTRVAKAKEKLIRAQERKSTLQKNFDALVSEIRAKGYEPSQLKAIKEQLVADLNAKKQELEQKLSEAERQLDSIPE